MSPDIFFVILLVIAMVVFVLVMEIRKRLLQSRLIQNHMLHKVPYDTTENPHAVYDAYYKAQRQHFENSTKVSFAVDDKTWSDLSLEDVFNNMNYAYTSVGENHLYSALRLMTPLQHYSFLNHLTDHPQEHTYIVKRLVNIGKTIYPTYRHDQFEEHRRWYHWLLTALPFLGVLVCFLDLGIGLLWICFALLINVVVSFRFNYYLGKSLKELFLIGRVVRETDHLSKLSITPEFTHSLKSVSQVSRFRFLLLNVETIPGYIVTIFKYMFLIDFHFYHTLVHRYNEQTEAVLACFNYIGEIDSLLAIDLYRYHHETTTPIESNEVSFKGLTHPLIEDAVPNDFLFNQNVLLTGSNASGKSTFMKAVALNLIMAQAINTVTAQAFTYIPGTVKTTMANADDVMSGDSYFMAELKSLKRLFTEHHRHQYYYFIDEIFKGTNTTERVAASHAVLDYLNQQPQLLVIAATHDIELTKVLQSQYANYHFNEHVTEGEIVFDYEIKQGPANTRNALELIRIMQFPKTIYTEAQHYVQQLEE